MRASRLDHLVLTVRDLDRTVAWYVAVLGMRPLESGEGRRALVLGQQTLNLHLAGHEIEPHAAAPTPGSSDLCFLVDPSIAGVQAELDALGVAVEVGPVAREGATGPMTSVYVRDPDGNLVEIAVANA